MGEEEEDRRRRGEEEGRREEGDWGGEERRRGGGGGGGSGRPTLPQYWKLLHCGHTLKSFGWPTTSHQGLTLVHFSAQPEPFLT